SVSLNARTRAYVETVRKRDVEKEAAQETGENPRRPRRRHRRRRRGRPLRDAPEGQGARPVLRHGEVGQQLPERLQATRGGGAQEERHLRNHALLLRPL